MEFFIKEQMRGKIRNVKGDCYGCGEIFSEYLEGFLGCFSKEKNDYLYMPTGVGVHIQEEIK